MRWVYAGCWGFGLAMVAALAVLAMQALALDRPAAPAASAPSVFVGDRADHLLDFGTIGAIDASTLPGILSRMTPSNGRAPGVGHQFYGGGKLWLRFDMPRIETDGERVVIRLGNTRVREARLVVFRDDTFTERLWSYDSPERRARLSTRIPLFEFDAAELGGAQLLLGFNSLGAMRAAVTVQAESVSDAVERHQALKYGVLVGFLAALAVYLTVIGTRLGERSLVFAAGLCFFIATFVAGVGGYVHTVLLAPWPRLADALLYGTQPVMMTFWMLLAINYLDVPRRAPLFGAVLTVIAMLLPLQGLLTVATALGYPIPFITDNATPVMVGILAGMAPVIWYSLRGDRRALALLACFTPVAITSAIRVWLYLAPSADPFWVLFFESFVDVIATMALLAILIVLDIRNRETALRRQATRNERRFRDYAEIATDSYFETDARGRVVSSAGRVTRELGLVEGSRIDDVLAARAAPEEVSALERFRSALGAGGEVRDLEFATTGSGGQGSWLSFNVVPFHADAGSGLRGTITDITERVERRRREARQNTLSALGQLASGVAHEVNNLLHPIVNLAQRVRDKHTQDEEARRLLDMVVASGRHAGEIVAGVLNAFNPVRTPGERVALARALEGALATVGATLPGTVALRRQLADVGGISVPAGEMLQLVSNLLANAIRAMDGVGEVAVTLAATEGGAVLTFADNGPGMPEDIRKRATEPFVTGRPDGTGLGLAVVANIVRNWRGEIEIGSTPGRGTSIVIRLPRDEDGYG